MALLRQLILRVQIHSDFLSPNSNPREKKITLRHLPAPFPQETQAKKMILK